MKSLNSLNVAYVKKLNQLNNDNKNAFMIVSNYVKYSFHKSESDSIVILNDMLDHLLEAQEEGVETEEFFGNDLQGFAKELVHELPNEPVNKWRWFYIFIIFLTIGSLLVPFGLLDFVKFWITNAHIKLPLLSIVMILIVFMIIQILLIKFTIENAKESRLNSTHSKSIVLCCFILMMVVPIVLTVLYPMGKVQEINPWIFTVVGCLAIIVSIWIYQKKIKLGGQ